MCALLGRDMLRELNVIRLQHEPDFSKWGQNRTLSGVIPEILDRHLMETKVAHTRSGVFRTVDRSLRSHGTRSRYVFKG